MEEHEDSLIWVYGLCRKGEEYVPTVPDVEGTSNYTLVATSQVVALASQVPTQEYGQSAVQQNIANNEWLVPRMVAYANVIADTFENTLIMPWRFGTVFESDRRLLDVLQTHEPMLLQTLEKVRGTEEWGLKVFAHVDNRAAALVEDQLQTAMAQGMPPGRMHFIRRKLAPSMQAQAQAELKAMALAMHQRIESCGYPAHVIGKNNNERLKTGEVLTFKAAYLVSKNSREPFFSLVDNLRREYTHQNIVLALTGPWAPYSFCDDVMPYLNGVD